MTVLVRDRMLDTRLGRQDGVIDVEVDGETVVFQPEHESLTVLDRVGTVIWTLLDGSATLRVLCEELAEAYQAPVEQVQSDVLTLVSQLQQDDLLSEIP